MKINRKTYTVLGLYHDTGETFRHYVLAYDAFEAMEKGAEYADYSTDLVIIGAVKGKVQLLTPGADNIMSVYASNYEGSTGNANG